MRVPNIALAVAFLSAAACGSGSGGEVGGFAHVPSAAAIVGSYEVTTMRNGTTSTSVGAVGSSDGVCVTLTDPPVSLQGALEHDGTIMLRGHSTNSDSIRFVDAEARAQLSNGSFRITGTLDDGESFVMVRALGADQSSQSGRYRIRFLPSPQHSRGNGTIDVALSVEPTGLTQIDAGAEHDTNGAAIAMWSFARITVAPNGRFQIDTQYEPATDEECLFGPCRIELIGTLPIETADVPTTGTYSHLDGLFMFQSGGTIEITRLGALP